MPGQCICELYIKRMILGFESHDKIFSGNVTGTDIFGEFVIEIIPESQYFKRNIPAAIPPSRTAAKTMSYHFTLGI